MGRWASPPRGPAPPRPGHAPQPRLRPKPTLNSRPLVTTTNGRPRSAPEAADWSAPRLPRGESRGVPERGGGEGVPRGFRPARCPPLPFPGPAAGGDSSCIPRSRASPAGLPPRARRLRAVSAPRTCGRRLPSAASLAGGAMGCGNSTAASAGAGRGEPAGRGSCGRDQGTDGRKGGDRPWETRGAQSPLPVPIFGTGADRSFLERPRERACAWPLPRAGAVTPAPGEPGRERREDCHRGPLQWVGLSTLQGVRLAGRGPGAPSHPLPLAPPGLSPSPADPRRCTGKSAAEQIGTFLGMGVGQSASGVAESCNRVRPPGLRPTGLRSCSSQDDSICVTELRYWPSY